MLAWVGAASWVGGEDLRTALLRRAIFGSPLIELRSPLAGSRLPPGGVAVAAGFPLADRTLPETLSVRLNGRPITAELTRGRSGVVGSVPGSVEGENRLEIRVFGRAWWGQDHYEDRVEVVFWIGPNFWLDRAGLLDTRPPEPTLREVSIGH